MFIESFELQIYGPDGTFDNVSDANLVQIDLSGDKSTQ